MRLPDDLWEHVLHAQDQVHRALTTWDAANPERCQSCCELLQRAVAELAGAEQAVKRNPEAVHPGLRKQMVQLRADVLMMARLVDASLAFCRGLERTIGQDTTSNAYAETVPSLPFGVEA